LGTTYVSWKSYIFLIREGIKGFPQLIHSLKSKTFLKFPKFPAYLCIMSVLIFIRFSYGNRYQIGNLYTNIMVGHHRKIWATVTDEDDRKYYENKSRVEGRVMIFKSKISKIKTITSDRKSNSLRYNPRESTNKFIYTVLALTND